MVADVVRFYKWLFLDFGLQNYSIGNKDVLPFFLVHTNERPNLFYSIWPRKENTQCLFYKNNVIKFNFTVYWCETRDKEKSSSRGINLRHRGSTRRWLIRNKVRCNRRVSQRAKDVLIWSEGKRRNRKYHRKMSNKFELWL